MIKFLLVLSGLLLGWSGLKRLTWSRDEEWLSRIEHILTERAHIALEEDDLVKDEEVDRIANIVGYNAMRREQDRKAFWGGVLFSLGFFIVVTVLFFL